MAQNGPLIAGTIWEENGVKGHFYYVPVKVPQTLTHVQVPLKQTGVFVPLTTEYSPKHVEQYNLDGIVTQGTSQFRVIITVRTPFNFFPPLRKSQVVPAQYERFLGVIRNGTTEERVKFTRAIDELRDLTIVRPSGAETVRPDGTVVNEASIPLTLGGRSENLASTYQELQHRVPLPAMTEHNGEKGAWFQVKVSPANHVVPAGSVQVDGVQYNYSAQTTRCTAEQIDLFVKWTETYGPVTFYPSDSYFEVEAMVYMAQEPVFVRVPNRIQYQFWPPAFIGQKVPPPHQSMIQTRKVEVVPTGRVRTPKTPPFAESRNGVKGHVYDVVFPKCQKMVPAGRGMIDGIPRTYQYQVVAVFPPSVRIWVRDTVEHQGPVNVNPPPTIEFNIQLDPIASKPYAVKTTKVVENWPRDWAFRFYAPALPGQKVPKYNDWEEKIDARNSCRTYMMDRRGRDAYPLLIARDGCLQPSEVARRKGGIKEPQPFPVDYSNYGAIPDEVITVADDSVASDTVAEDNGLASGLSELAMEPRSRSRGRTLRRDDTPVGPGEGFEFQENYFNAQDGRPVPHGVWPITEEERLRNEQAQKKRDNKKSFRFLR